MPMTLDEGKAAVVLARDTLEAHVNGTRRAPAKRAPAIFKEKRGVFVTLNKEISGSTMLRGCIGYSEPVKPLGEAIRDVTVYASEDPRFPHPVLPDELDRIVVEVSVLTPPQDLATARRLDLPSKVRLGTDGLIISNLYTSGVFLPQVATEQGWDQETYISEACSKAGLPMDAWLDEGTRVQVFQAEIFAESKPRGEVAMVNPES
ncbi:MAG: TIGR00296 family protein [Thaumarchaeota archaeon]|nr:TIGR00296 family protein [Nitrososphaerota archaeon]